MSGAEALAVLGVISSVISIVETCQKISEAAKDARGLHETFRKASEYIPLILDTLREARKVQEQATVNYVNTNDVALKHAIEDTSRAVEPILQCCKANVEALRDIFEKLIPDAKASRFGRYSKPVHTVMPGKKVKVKQLMKEILGELQMLHTH